MLDKQQTPDAVREARKIVALNSSLPPDAVNAGLFDDAPIMRCTLAALDSRAGDAGEVRNPNAYVLLEPDAEDVRLCLKGAIPACPCCGGTPSTFSRFFPHSGIYQGYVNCSRCHVQVLANARDRDDARGLAIAAWSKRPATPAPAVDAVPAGEVERS